MNNSQKFDKAIQVVNDDRGADYGHPLDDFRRAAVIKAAVHECKDDAVRHALEMIGVKMARLVHSPDHLDSAIDIAGYARTICMINDKRAEETKDADQ